MKLIDVKDASFRYQNNERFIIQNLSCSVYAGKILRIQGRNGSGKSTLLKILSNSYQFTDGVAEYHKNALPVYMDQFAGDMLSFDLTIGEQLEGFAHDKEILKFIYESLSVFGLNLETRLDSFVGHLSGGQRQIVALLSVIATGANVICLDEFISALDQTSIDIACRLINEIKNKYDLAIVVVSHNQLPIEIDEKIILEIE